jgi:hypothetical protein
MVRLGDAIDEAFAAPGAANALAAEPVPTVPASSGRKRAAAASSPPS